ncbi:profilin [Diutina catenulata]
MSWQAYTDQLVATGKLDKAALYSAAGDSLWAQTGGFEIKPEEITAIAKAYADPAELQAHGLNVAGEPYLLLRSDDRSIYGRGKGKDKDLTGVIAVKTKQAILVAHYPQGVVANEATIIVEKLADYLISVGY